MIYELMLSTTLLAPQACVAAAPAVPTCRSDRTSASTERTALPPRTERERVFSVAGILPLLDRRGLDEVERDLLFVSARAGDIRHLEARYPWLSTLQREALVRSAALEHDEASCQSPPNAVEVFWIGERTVQPGEKIELRPVWTNRPGSFEDIPAKCITDLTLSENAPAVLLERERSLQVSKDAVHGTQFTVAGKIGDQAFSGELRVLVPSLAPLVGSWKQDSIDCKSDRIPAPGTIPSRHKDPIQELMIYADNTFSVTWVQPFESYRDYWGSYSFDINFGAVEFTVEGGNRLPGTFDGSGTARRLGDRLVFVDVDFGHAGWFPANGCTVTFIER